MNVKKKMLVMVVIGCVAAGLVGAQERTPPPDAQQGRMPRTPPEPAQQITVSGTLELKDSFIALVSGEQVYYVPWLERFAGFIDGIKEGAQVTVDGFAFGNRGGNRADNREQNFLRPVKITLNGKSYDVGGPQNGGPRARNNRGMLWGRGGKPMRGGCR